MNVKRNKDKESVSDFQS